MAKPRSLTFKAAVLTGNQVILQVVSTVLGIVVARMLALEDLGTWRQLTLLYGLVAPVFIAAVPTSLLYFLPRVDDEDGRRRLVGQTVAFLGASGLLMALGLRVAADPIAAYFNNPELARTLGPYSLNVFMTVASSYFYVLMVATNQVKWATVHTLGFGILNLVGQVAGIFVSRDVDGLILGSNITRAIQLGATIILTMRIVGLRVSIRGGVIGLAEQARYCWPVALSGIVGTVGYQIDQLVVGRVVSPEMFAIYVIGAIEIPLVAQLVGSVNSVLVPEMSARYHRGDVTGIVELWHAATRKVGLLVFPAFWYFLIISEDFITLLYSEKYAASVPFFIVYLMLTPLRVVTYSVVATAIGRTDLILRGSVLFIGLNLTLSVTLVGPLGAYGAALATVFATAALGGYQLLMTGRMLGISVGLLLPWKSMLRQFVLVGLSAAVAWPATLAEIGAFGRIVVAGVVFVAAYAAVFWTGSLVPPSEHREIVGQIRRLMFRK